MRDSIFRNLPLFDQVSTTSPVAVSVEKLKEEGQQKALSNAEEWYKQQFEQTVKAIPVGKTFTSDYIVKIVGVPKEKVKRNVIGALISSLKSQGVISHFDYAASERKSRHGGLVRVWKRI